MISKLKKVALDIKSGDEIVYINSKGEQVIAGIVDKSYLMVDNEIQFRLLKGGLYSAVTYKRNAMVGVV